MRRSLLFLSALTLFAQGASATNATGQSALLQHAAQLAKDSKDSTEAAQKFEQDAVLKAGTTFTSSADTWSLTLKMPMAARAVCDTWKLARCYLVSGDVHQENFAIALWTQNIKSPYGIRLGMKDPQLGKWNVETQSKRPKGVLPHIMAGASPAYDLRQYDAPVTGLNFNAAHP